MALGDRIELVEHEINDHAGYGDVEPERQGPACQTPVARPLRLPGPSQGEQHQRHNHGGQNRVRNQDREIDQPYAALTREGF